MFSVTFSFVVFLNIGNKEEEEEEEEATGFEGTPKPMLPYSSMFIFGPTNPYANEIIIMILLSTIVCLLLSTIV